jgi:hypothetical protein
MTKRTLKSVNSELRRTIRAAKALKKDLSGVMKDIGAKGGLDAEEHGLQKVSPNLRRLRELQKSIDVLAKIEKSLNIELAMLEATQRQEQEESAYAL